MKYKLEDRRRKASHKKNNILENLFPEMIELLAPVEEKALQRFNKPKKKVFFIVGCARSGSTLLYQYLAKTNLFAYPTNLVSRFYYAPYVGARVQQLLLDNDSKGEIFNIENNQFEYESKLGKTSGAGAPHEFWYFWDRFFKFDDLQQLSEKSKKNINWELFNKELHAFESAFDKPILMKAMKLNWHLDLLVKNIPNVHIIFIKRDVLYNAQSLLQAREDFFGNKESWYSFKTENYSELNKLSPEKQVVHQVFGTNKAIQQQLDLLEKSQYTTINYEDFCESPNELMINLYKSAGLTLRGELLNSQFDSGNRRKLDNKTFNLLIKVINEL